MRLRTRLALAVVLAALPLGAATVVLRIDLERRRLEQVLREFAVTVMERGGREACEADPATFPRPLDGPPRRRGGPLSGRPAEGFSGWPPPGPGAGPRGDGPRPERPRADDPLGSDPFGPGPRGDRPPPPGGEDAGPPPRGPDAGQARGGGGETAPPAAAPPPPARDTKRRFWAYEPDFHSANPKAPPVHPDLVRALEEGSDVASRRYTDGDAAGHEALVRMAWDTGPAAFVLVRREEAPREADVLEPWIAGALVGGGVLIAVFLAAGPVVRRIRRLEDDVRAAARQTYARPVTVTGDDEIAALATAFNDAAEVVRARVADLEAREETLRRFVADTTHDVMTPLTVLQGHLSTLRDAVAGGAAATRDAARDALREVDYTTSLLANLAAAAKLEGGASSFTLHAVDLNELVARVAARFGPVAAAQDVELNHSVPEEAIAVTGDVTLLEQAIGNVVQNAVRYNRVGGHVALVLRTEPAGRFSVRVTDDGPGVPGGRIEALEERGVRGDAARTRAPDGHGIGLDIVRGVCARHGIELEFRTPAGGGLEVVFSGPARL